MGNKKQEMNDAYDYVKSYVCRKTSAMQVRTVAYNFNGTSQKQRQLKAHPHSVDKTKSVIRF